MTTKSASFATAMSRFALSAAIASCMRVESSGIDEPDAYVPGTSLDEPIWCGSTQCGSGTLCASWSSVFDAGIPTSMACVIVPVGCRVVDCGRFTYQGCPRCIYELCGFSSDVGAYLEYRSLYCRS